MFVTWPTELHKPDRQWRSSSFQESKKVRVSRDIWPLTLTFSTPCMHAYPETIACKFGGDPAICLREEAICAKVYRQAERRTDDGRRAIALAHSWNELKIGYDHGYGYGKVKRFLCYIWILIFNLTNCLQWGSRVWSAVWCIKPIHSRVIRIKQRYIAIQSYKCVLKILIIIRKNSESVEVCH